MELETSSYGFGTDVALSYEDAIARVTSLLKDEGFGTLTTIDVRETLKAKLGVDFQRYVILGACNPKLAHRALGVELEIGLMLPCNVIVYEREGGAHVSFMDPAAALGVVRNRELEAVAEEARDRLQRVAAKLPRPGH